MYKFPKIRMITAMTPQRGIGFKGKLPWEAYGIRLLEDMKHFKTLTSSETQRNAVVMGRATWESLPASVKPLPNRTNYVLSHKQQTTYTMSSIENCIEHVTATNHDELWVIGGESVYTQFLKKQLVDDIWITVVNTEFQADRFFPEIPSFKKTHTIMNNESPIHIFGKSCGILDPTHTPTICLFFERWEKIPPLSPTSSPVLTNYTTEGAFHMTHAK